ncbi:MAG: SH3 domain-containing protein [Saprospiraceae bacterium]
MYSSKIITICFLLFSFFTNAQDFQLNGRVSILNSRVDNGPIKYVREAIIRNDLSPDKVTDYKGRFELKFIDHDPNSMINLTVEKEGYEVVNKDILKGIQISKNPTIRIFLAKKGKVAKKEKGLLKFSQTIIFERKDSIFQLLNLMAVSKDNILEKLESNLGQKISDEMEAKLLLNRLDQDLEKELPSLIRKMASVNIDFASNRYKNAISFFQNNQLDRAIEILDEKELDTSYENILASIEKAKETPASYQKILNIRSIQIGNIIESFELKRTLLKLAFRVVEAEDLGEKITKMKTMIKLNQPPQILEDKNEPEDIVEVNQVVNILLEDSMHLALPDTNWVELEMEKLVSKGEGEEELTGDPKAKTILETSPSNTGGWTLGVDFENTLLRKSNVEPNRIPIYEQPASMLVSSEKVVNSIPDESLETTEDDAWLAIAEKVESEAAKAPSAAIQKEKEIKKVNPKSERMVFNDVIEPNYPVYKITKKTSLRQQATASSKVLKRLKIGTKVKVIDQVDRYWSKVILNGKVGYVKVLLLEK